MFDSLLRMHLGPVKEELAELQEGVEAGRRQGNNLIQKGVIASAPGGTRVIVDLGENKTPPIQFLVPAAGVTSTYRCPSPGEIAIVLNFGAGDGFDSCIALCGLASTAFPLASDNPAEVVTKFGDSAYTRVNVETGAMEVCAKGGVTFVDTPFVKNQDGDVADKVRTMADDRKIYDGHNHPGDSGGTTGSPNQKQGG